MVATALFGAAACSSGSKPMDDGLKQDLAAAGGKAADASGLELAPKSATSQLTISAIEGGPTSAPAPAAHKPVPRPSPKPAMHLASNRHQPVSAPSPAPVTVEQAPSAPAPEPQPAPEPVREPAPRASEPAPLPPMASPSRGAGRQSGVYKTEGEVFKQMPWIKP